MIVIYNYMGVSLIFGEISNFNLAGPFVLLLTIMYIVYENISIVHFQFLELTLILSHIRMFKPFMKV